MKNSKSSPLTNQQESECDYKQYISIFYDKIFGLKNLLSSLLGFKYSHKLNQILKLFSKFTSEFPKYINDFKNDYDRCCDLVQNYENQKRITYDFIKNKRNIYKSKFKNNKNKSSEEKESLINFIKENIMKDCICIRWFENLKVFYEENEAEIYKLFFKHFKNHYSLFNNIDDFKNYIENFLIETGKEIKEREQSHSPSKAGKIKVKIDTTDNKKVIKLNNGNSKDNNNINDCIYINDDIIEEELNTNKVSNNIDNNKSNNSNSNNNKITCNSNNINKVLETNKEADTIQAYDRSNNNSLNNSLIIDNENCENEELLEQQGKLEITKKFKKPIKKIIIQNFYEENVGNKEQELLTSQNSTKNSTCADNNSNKASNNNTNSSKKYKKKMVIQNFFY